MAVTIVLAVSVSFYAGIKIFPKVAQRFSTAESVIKYSTDTLTQSTEGTAQRLLIWKATLEIIRQHPITGTGTGDIKDALVERYKSSNNFIAYEKKFNAHNQYLQTFAALGIVGFLRWH